MSTRVMPSVRPLRDRPAWKALEKHYDELQGKHLRELFAADGPAASGWWPRAPGLYLDYSKNRITDETIRLLVALAEQSGLAERIEAMFAGERINVSENRSVLHVALRMPRERFADRRRRRRRRGGARGARPDVGVRRAGPLGRVEGPHRQADPQRRQHRHRRLGPRAGDGLRGAAPLLSDRDLTFRFVSNVDSTDFVEATRDLDPAETLFIVSSKTFTTLETMTNARSARDWALAALGDEAGDRQALRRGLDQRREGDRVRHRHRQHVRVLGMGGRALLDGLGDRPLDDARDRPRAASTSCSRASTRSTSTSAAPRSSRTCRC